MIDRRFATIGDPVMTEGAHVLTGEGHRDRSLLVISSALDSGAIPALQLGLLLGSFRRRRRMELNWAVEKYRPNPIFPGASQLTRPGRSRRKFAAELESARALQNGWVR
jgi:hypothetical protein